MTNEGQMDSYQFYEVSEKQHGFSWYVKQAITKPLYLGMIIALIVLFLFTRDRSIQANLFLTVATVIVSIFMLVKASDWWLKSRTAALLVSQLKTTTRGKPLVSYGAFDIWSMGDVDAYGLSWHGSEGAIIVPTAARNNVGRSIAYPVRVLKHPFSYLPIPLQRILTQHNINRDNIYIGLIDDTQADDEVDMEKVIPELAKYNVLNDKILEKLSKLKKVPAKYLAQLWLDSALSSNSVWLAYEAMSWKAQTMAGDIRRVGDTNDSSWAGKAMKKALTGEDSQR